MGLISWWKESRRWHQDNNKSWDGMDIPMESGLTRFQEICLEAFTNIVDITESQVVGTNERYITGSLQKSNVTYYIYEDGAELSGEGIDWRLERWDFRTLDELVIDFTDKARKIESGSLK